MEGLFSDKDDIDPIILVIKLELSEFGMHVNSPSVNVESAWPLTIGSIAVNKLNTSTTLK